MAATVPLPDLDEMLEYVDQTAPGTVACLKRLSLWFDLFCSRAAAIEAGREAIAYHYTSLDILRKITQGGSKPGELEFWSGNIADLNDEVELWLGVDCLDMIASRWPGPRPWPLDKALKVLLQGGPAEAFSFSMSRHRDSDEMWDGYGDEGHGVAIGIDLNQLYGVVGLLPVAITYEPEAFMRRCCEAFPAFVECCREYGDRLPQRSDVTPLRTILSCVALQYKLDAPGMRPWSVEQEIRLLQWQVRGIQDSLRTKGARRFAAFHLPRSAVRELVPGPSHTNAESTEFAELRTELGV